MPNKKTNNTKEENKKKKTEESKKLKTNSNTKKPTKTPKEKKPKIDYKKKFEELEKQMMLKESKIFGLELEKKKLEVQFQETSKGFALKAKDEITKLKKELAEKSKKDLEKSIKYAPQKFIDSIYEPLINIEMAVKAGENQGPEVQAYVMGFKMLLAQMFDTFSRFGIQFITPKEGDSYDPVIHDVFGKEEGPKDKILKLKKKGMKLHDRVIKPALVVIGK